MLSLLKFIYLFLFLKKFRISCYVISLCPWSTSLLICFVAGFGRLWPGCRSLRLRLRQRQEKDNVLRWFGKSTRSPGRQKNGKEKDNVFTLILLQREDGRPRYFRESMFFSMCCLFNKIKEKRKNANVFSGHFYIKYILG